MNFQNEKLKRHWAVGGYDFNLYYVDIRDIDWHPQTAEEVPHKVKARYPAHFQLLVFNLGLAFLLHTGFGPRL